MVMGDRVEEVDVVVVGGGPGGYSAAFRCADLGLETVIVDAGARLGGVIVGFLGVLLLFGVDLQGSLAELLGGLAVVLASVGYSVGGFWVKHRLRDAAPIGVVAAVMAASALELAIPAALTAPASVNAAT